MGVDAMIWVTTPEPVSDDLLMDWSWRLADAFGDAVTHRPPSGRGDGRAALARADEDEARSFGVDVPQGDTVLEVATLMRYYGPGYERGPLVQLMGICRWLATMVPQATVWYGNDSGDTARKWTRELDCDLWEHFVRHGSAPYHLSFGKHQDPCTWCRAPMAWFMGSADASGYECLGCGLRRAVYLDGTVAEGPRGPSRPMEWPKPAPTPQDPTDAGQGRE